MRKETCRTLMPIFLRFLIVVMPGILAEQVEVQGRPSVPIHSICISDIAYLYDNRSFEYLGATSSSSTTPSPGESSFTSALIWALQKFAEEEVPKKFTMTELANKIRTAPNFPPAQVPTLIARDPQSAQRIVLSALPSEGEQDLRIEETKAVVPECLELRFYFDREPEDHELKELALALTRHINTFKGGSLYRIAFGRLYSVVHNAAKRWAGGRWRGTGQANDASLISEPPLMTENRRSQPIGTPVKTARATRRRKAFGKAKRALSSSIRRRSKRGTQV